MALFSLNTWKGWGKGHCIPRMPRMGSAFGLSLMLRASSSRRCHSCRYRALVCHSSLCCLTSCVRYSSPALSPLRPEEGRQTLKRVFFCEPGVSLFPSPSNHFIQHFSMHIVSEAKYYIPLKHNIFWSLEAFHASCDLGTQVKWEQRNHSLTVYILSVNKQLCAPGLLF